MNDVFTKDHCITSVLSEVFSSLVPLRKQLSASVSFGKCLFICPLYDLNLPEIAAKFVSFSLQRLANDFIEIGAHANKTEVR